ncbi:L-aspartate oxidase [Megamonas funiformis]|jgi:L-aspartate oxidase|uniref:L-aspartate oxidase n=1 Tax=Megamonas funiformis TaxID=437897 RepID=UPI000E5389B5|nr:L-aspartate oxidase [Megamonas funiformis]RGW49086.1 L-aspartate oxidase [Megamonas funiformis]
MQNYKTDILIVGTGASGLFAALHCPSDKNILMITKDAVENSDSFLAQGGICVLRDENDYNSFMEDTLKAGHYENRRESVDIMIRSSREVINELIGYGVDFARQENGELNYTREGCHSKARILFHEDITGKEITRNLLKAVQKLPNVHILEYVTMLDLIEQDNTCFGILAKDKNDEYLTIEADNTILASGGIGGLYEHSTNYPHLTGDAIAIALRHNIKLENPDYVQIHPTSLYTNKPGRSFLISESVRGEGAKLYGKDRKRFANEVLPRDLMTAEIKKQMAKDNMPYVWLDMTVLGKDVILNHFPHIYEKCLEEGFDVTKQWIPIVPAQHYYMGGIHVDKYSKTTMNNLYAVGETSCNGVHGANRLASNSLLEGLVFAKRAVNKIHDDENAQHKKYDIDFAQLANNVQQNIDREKIILAQEYKKAIFNEMDKVRSAR